MRPDSFYKAILCIGLLYNPFSPACAEETNKVSLIRESTEATTNHFKPKRCYIILSDDSRTNTVLYTITLDTKLEPQEVDVSTNAPLERYMRLALDEFISQR